MERRLTPRREAVLKIVVDEYIRSGSPVPSQERAFHGLGVSPATVRNELAWLKSEGYLNQPHTSAGSVPTDKGYRYYVNSLLDQIDMPADEQRMVRHLFHQVEADIEEWVGLAAMMLSQLAHNAAFVVPARAARARLRHLHLVAVQNMMAMLVLVFQNGEVKRHLIAFEAALGQDSLDAMSNRLNSLYAGMTRDAIAGKRVELTSGEAQVVREVVGLMGTEDERRYEQPRLEGLRHLMGQPEFSRAAKLIDVMELIEKRGLLDSVMGRAGRGDISVVIGEENPEQALHDLTVVSSKYGVPQETTGAIGVLGPRRMSYSRSMATVRFLASLLSELAAELHSGERYRRNQ